jgi:hypothetical protein
LKYYFIFDFPLKYMCGKNKLELYMKISSKKLKTWSIALFIIFSVQILDAQCPLFANSASYGVPGGTLTPSTGTVFLTHIGYSPGTYFAMPMQFGGSYDISTCGASLDTQISGQFPAGTGIFFNDDNGPVCPGSAASIGSYAPNFSGFAFVQVSQFNCLQGGTSSINVSIRQNNNIVFTSSGAAICSGQARALSAIPARIATAVGSGDQGSFTCSTPTAITNGTLFIAPIVASPTNYTITYTFGYVSQTQIITVNPLPSISVSGGSICSGSSFTLTPSGASTYTYSGGSNIVTPTVNTTYSITGTSAQGCVSSNVAVSTVTVNATPTITVNSGVICSGRSFTMTPSGASTYTYSGGSSIVSPVTNTSYSVTGTSAQGCVSSNTAVSTVTVNTTPTITVNSGVICSGNSFTITPGGASTYTYSGGSAIVSPTANTSYSVTGTSAQGCVSSNTAVSTVTVNTTPTITVNSGVICSGNSFTITPGGASTYTYSGGSAIVSPTANTSYSVTGTSAQGCVSSSAAVSTVTVNTTPTVTVNSGVICSGSSFTMVPSGASTYTYSGGSAVVSPTANATYSVTGTSAQGCVSSNAAVSSVTVNSLPSVNAASNTSLICVGQSASLTASGATTYTWNNSANSSVIVISPTVTTSYSVTGTDNNGCVNTASVTQAVSPCTGLDAQITNSTEVEVYPNPNNGEFMLSLSTVTENTTVIVTNALGQVIYEKGGTHQKAKIDLSHQANGVYFVKIISNSKLVATKKIIKQ